MPRNDRWANVFNMSGDKLLATFAKDILAWYAQHQRSLPWRATSGAIANPYHVWLSEIMLQQTTVPAVKKFFHAYTSRWPTVHDLANATDEDILAAWAGLGYYARARNLIKTARIVAHDMDGAFPASEDALKALPGIGDYTAAAISAIAFGAHSVVVDSNVERVIARTAEIKTALPAAKKEIKIETSKVTPRKAAGDFAQAMMDLGSSICTPKAPKCGECPVVKHCKASKNGTMERYPVKAPKKLRPTRRALAYWLVVDGHVMIERRADKGLLGGMAGVPVSDWIEQEMCEALKSTPPFEADWRALDEIVKHTFTHFHLETTVMTATLSERPSSNHSWVKLDSVIGYGLPTVFKKMAAQALKAGK